MNSSWMSYSLSLFNPTVSFQVGDIARVPFQIPSGSQKLILEVSVISAIHFQQVRAVCDEKTFEFSSPLGWETGLKD